MPVICDKCDCDISLVDANEAENGDIVCDGCLNSAVAEWCDKCGLPMSQDQVAVRRGGRHCQGCLHAYELDRFNPPDHDAATCELCQANKARGKK